MQEEATNADVQDPETPDEVDPDAMTDTLRGLIAELNEDEKAALIAFVSIGRAITSDAIE
ncbi:hypothetical protein [Falsiroseomonas sp. E2-1-a20]|uniref:hypothetical protein n=1 Tax=Falsiroseomonas sp. E2-1-a20 TaxID=3239300 RepID=UPI003F357FB6